MSSVISPGDDAALATVAPSVTSHEEKKLTNSAAHPESPTDSTQYPTGLKFYLIMTSCWLFVFLCSLDQTIVSTAVPEVTNQFNSFTDVGWYGSAYLLTSTCFQPLFGRLYSSFTVKWVFLIALTIFELGSLICGVAPNSSTFIVGRAIAGLGVAGGYSGCLIIVSLIAPIHIRPLLVSSIGAVYGVAGTVGPIIGGAFTSETTWRWCFYFNLFFFPFVGLFIVLFLQIKPQPQNDSPIIRLLKLDWIGTLLSLCSVICLLLVLQWGGITYSWNDSKIIGLLVGFFVIGLTFIASQIYLGERATIVPRILKNRIVAFGSIVNFAVAAAYFNLLYFIPIYFQTVRGSSAIRSGVQTLPFIVAVIVSVTWSGFMINRFGYYIPYLFLGTILICVGSGLLYLLRPDSEQALWVGLQFLVGLGPGMAWMIPFSAASSVLDPIDIPVGSAMVIFFQTLGGTIFVSVAQSVFQNKFVLYLRQIPGIDPEKIIAHGVSAFRAFTPSDQLPAVISAANQAVNKTFLISVALGALGFLAVFGMKLSHRISPATPPHAGAL